MYLRSLHIQHLKRISDLELDFTHDGKPRMWTVLIGENGTAKTSILQAVALAAAGSLQVNTLARPIVKHLRDRRTDESLAIEASFEFSERSMADKAAHPKAEAERFSLVSSVSLNQGETSLESTSGYVSDSIFDPGQTSNPLNSARASHTHGWFVAGYGIARNLPDSTYTPALDLPSIDRMQPLFDPRYALASSSFANHFLVKDAIENRKAGATSRRYAQLLNEAIRLGGPALLPHISRMELRGQGGVKTATALIDSDRFYQRMGKSDHAIAGVALSHGYQSTIAWIADLIGHVLLESKEISTTTEMEGLVLVDEIDLYLHPAWQATFITALRKVFPRMQFVATTHSPVVLAEMAPHEIVRLVIDEESGDVRQGGWEPETGHVIPVSSPDPMQPDPRPMTASEIYRTWFGLDRLTPNPVGEELRRYRVLADDPSPSEKDQRECEQLRQKLIAAGITDLDDHEAAP